MRLIEQFKNGFVYLRKLKFPEEIQSVWYVHFRPLSSVTSRYLYDVAFSVGTGVKKLLTEVSPYSICLFEVKVERVFIVPEEVVLTYVN